jgi:hypothetical protein
MIRFKFLIFSRSPGRAVVHFCSRFVSWTLSRDSFLGLELDSIFGQSCLVISI